MSKAAEQTPSGWRETRSKPLIVMTETRAGFAMNRLLQLWADWIGLDLTPNATNHLIVAATRAELVKALARHTTLDCIAGNNIPWNATIDSRVVDFLDKMIHFIDQPNIVVASEQLCLGSPSRSQGPSARGLEGLRRALQDINAINFRAKHRQPAPVFFMVPPPDEIITHYQSQTRRALTRVRALAELEHVVLTTIARVKTAHQLEPPVENELPWRLDLPEDAETALCDNRAVAASAAQLLRPDNKPNGRRLAAIVVTMVKADLHDPKPPFAFYKEFDGPFEEALTRVETVLAYKFGYWRSHKSRINTVLQELLIKPAVNETGDHEADRCILRGVGSYAALIRIPYIIGLCLVQNKESDLGKHVDDLQSILEHWQNTQKVRPRKRFNSLITRRNWKLWLGPHEKNRWRMNGRPRVRAN